MSERGRAGRGGPDHIKILPGCLVVVGDTAEEALNKRASLDSLVHRDNGIASQLAQIASGYGGLAMVGTPNMIADQMEEWLLADACNGFNIMFPGSPAASTISSTGSSPNCSAATSSAAEGQTLGENLGLPRPANRFFEKRGF